MREGGARGLLASGAALVVLALLAEAAPAARAGSPAEAGAVGSAFAAGAAGAARAAAERGGTPGKKVLPHERLADLERAVREAPNDLLLGNSYRAAARAAGETRRAVEFLAGLAKQTGGAGPLGINLALAYVDRISEPGTNRIGRAKLSRRSIESLDVVLEKDPGDWIALFSRGMNHLHWPGRTHAARAVEDLERCLALRETASEPAPALLSVALGDAHVRDGDIPAARRAWEHATAVHPESEALSRRLAMSDEALRAFVEEERGESRAIDTDLSKLVRAPEGASAGSS